MTPLKQRIPVKRRFEFTSDAHADPDTFAVVRMKGFESISKPYRFELVLVSDDADIDFSRVLAADAHLDILAPDDESRRTPYGGMLAEFEQLHQAGGYTFYRAVLVPRVWRLMQYRNSEVYLHEQSVPGIIQRVLTEGQLRAGLDYELKLRTLYRPRSYVCQYQETPLDFLSRWMEKEGIYYHFAQVDGRERLSLLDASDTQPPHRLAVVYRPADELDTGLAADSVQSFSCRTRPMPRRVVLQDFNYRRASVPLVATADVDVGGIGEEMIYGENFRSLEEGEHYAAVRAQEILCGARVFHAESTAVGLRSGELMSLKAHYRAEFNADYLVTEITHEGSQAGALLAGLKTPWAEREGEIAYRNSFVALDAGRQFRPARTTPKPRVAGTMSATIDAEGSGEYAELDAFGQYRVQVPFDRTEKGASKGSAAVRMASPYAGSDHGMHFPLHKGAEVLLSFSDGDPDQPVIVGAVPNSMNPSVVHDRTQGQNLIQTAAGNVLNMSDKRGGQSIYMSTLSAKSLFHIGLLKREKSEEDKGGMTPEEIKKQIEETVKEEIERNEKETEAKKKKEMEKTADEQIEKKEKKDKEGKEHEEASGILMQTEGEKYELTYGNEAKINFGSKNDFSVGQKNEWSASLASELSWGFKVGVNASTGMEWKLDPLLLPSLSPLEVAQFKKLDINDAGEVEFVGADFKKSASKAIEFKGGIVENSSYWLSTRAGLGVMRALILAQAAGNLVEQLLVAKAIKAGDSLDRETEAAGRLGGNLALFLVTQIWSRRISGQLEHAPATSALKLDDQGIDATVNAQGAPGAVHSRIHLDQAAGMTLRSDLKSDWAGVATATQITLNTGSVQVSAKTSAAIRAPTVTMRSTGAPVASVQATDQGKVTLTAGTSTLEMEPTKATLVSAEVNIGAGVAVPNPLIGVLTGQLQAVQVVAAAAHATLDGLQTPETVMAILFSPLDSSVAWAAHTELMDAALAAVAAADAEVLRVQQQLTAAQALNAVNIINGLTVTSAETKITGGASKAVVSATGAEMSCGAAKFQAAPAGITVDGPIVKLG